MIKYINFNIQTCLLDLDAEHKNHTLNYLYKNNNIERFNTLENLKHFIEENDFDRRTSDLLFASDSNNDTQLSITLDLNKLSHLVIEMLKQNCYPVGIVIAYYKNYKDHADLIENFKNFSQKGIRIILICKNDDISSIIRALNRNEINSFLCTSDTNFDEEITKSVHANKLCYLNFLNDKLHHFFNANNYVNELYNDAHFQNFYNKKCAQLSIKSSAIYEYFGSRILLSNDLAYLLNIYWADELNSLVLPNVTNGDNSLAEGKTILDYKSIDNIVIPRPYTKNWGKQIANVEEKFFINDQEVFIKIRPFPFKLR